VLRRWRALRVVRQEARQRIVDRLELLGGSRVQVRSRLGQGEATLGNGFQSLPLVVPVHRSHMPARPMALMPVGRSIGAQDMCRSPACPAKTKRVHAKRGTRDNQRPADEVVPSGLQELHGRLHVGINPSTIARKRLRESSGGRALQGACGATTRNARVGRTGGRLQRAPRTLPHSG